MPVATAPLASPIVAKLEEVRGFAEALTQGGHADARGDTLRFVSGLRDWAADHRDELRGALTNPLLAPAARFLSLTSGRLAAAEGGPAGQSFEAQAPAIRAEAQRLSDTLEPLRAAERVAGPAVPPPAAAPRAHRPGA